MRINKLIFYTIFETIMLISVVFSTYLLWDSFDTDSKEIALSYTSQVKHLTLSLENNLIPLAPTNDTKGINDKSKITLKLNNQAKIKKQYYIYLKINENTNLDTKYLKIFLNDEPRYLYTLENFKENNEKYYILTTGIVNKEEEIVQDLYIWLSEETPNSEQNKTLNFEINVEEM